MKYFISSIVMLLILSFSDGNQKDTDTSLSDITLDTRDKAIVEKVVADFKHDSGMGISLLVVKVGKSLLGTPYVANTLEGSNSEKLVINLRELDCTTFAENCLALARTIEHQHPTYEQFTKELLSIRYRDGFINQYPSRLHYFSDWIYDNSQKGFVADLSEQMGSTSLNKQINFMTQHVANYPALKDRPSFVQSIALQEAAISNRKAFYIPKHKLPTIENQLQDGDILGITTSIKGLDASHVVICVRLNGNMHFIHASQTHHKVVISNETLEQYLNSSKSATGIMVARPL